MHQRKERNGKGSLKCTCTAVCVNFAALGSFACLVGDFVPEWSGDMYVGNSAVRGKSSCQTNERWRENGEQKARYAVRYTKRSEVIMEIKLRCAMLVPTSLYWDSVCWIRHFVTWWFGNAY
jgi:hypothetical protein